MERGDLLSKEKLLYFSNKTCLAQQNQWKFSTEKTTYILCNKLHILCHTFRICTDVVEKVLHIYFHLVWLQHLQFEFDIQFKWDCNLFKIYTNAERVLFIN